MMRAMIRTYWILLVGAPLILAAGCGEEAPSRGHIPRLRAALYDLQEAIKEQDQAVLDSLLSVKILRVNQSSDSLLSFVYGEDGSFGFEQLILGEITYIEDKARIDCFVADSLGKKDRPLVLTYVWEHDMWLLKRFEPGEAQDST